jgi:hypothetical protein
MDERETQRAGYPLTIPDSLLNSEAMRQACATRNFREIFRLVNRRTGSSHADMAAAIGKMTSSRVSDIIRGVRGLRQQVHTLDARYVTEPSTALIAEIGQYLGQLAYWHTHTPTYVVRRDLYAAQAEVSTLMGQLVWDASGRTDHDTPRKHFAQAAEAARELRDPVAEGLALLRTSFVALYGEKSPRAGLELAQHAAETVENASHVLTGLAVLHVAEAYAMLQQRRDCEKALNSAEWHFSQVDANDAGASMLSPGQFGRLAGSCFLSLNDTARAQAVLEGTAKELREGAIEVAAD